MASTVKKAALLLLAALLLSSFSLFRKKIRYQDRTYREGQRIEVYGGIILVGNEPFTRYVIEDHDGEQFFLDISEWDGDELPQNDVKIFLVSGKLQIRELTLADGSRTIVERTILLEELAIPAVDY